MYEESFLKNGLRIVTKRLDGRASIGLAIWVKVGGRYEQKNLAGVSHFVEHMLFKGTKTRSTKLIKEGIEGIGGVMNAFTSEECTCYFVKIPKSYLEQSFDVLQDMVNESILKVEEIKKERTVILEEIKMYLDLPSQHVHEVMSELLWPNQPLGQPIAGTFETVSKMTRRNLFHHVGAYYHPKNMLITACGEIGHGQITSLTEHYFSNRTLRTPSWFRPLKQTNHRNSIFRFIDKKTEQTHFVIGFHGLPRDHKDRYRLGILNVILGGNMSSRLFEEVREQRGLAYEIKSGLSFFHDTGSLTISAGVEPQKASLAVRVIMRELNRLKKTPVTKNFYPLKYTTILTNALQSPKKSHWSPDTPCEAQAAKMVKIAALIAIT